MTRQRSPYTGRPVDEWLDRDIKLHDADGDDIGKVVEVNPDFIVAESDGGFLGLGERRTYYIPREQLMRQDQDEDDWYLHVDRDDIDTMGWTSRPTQSAWSQDRDVSEAVEPAARRDGLRIRRYEEDLEADTVLRAAGEVVVRKNVVEDTRGIDVPVRRDASKARSKRCAVEMVSRTNLLIAVDTPARLAANPRLTRCRIRDEAGRHSRASHHAGA